MQDKLLAHFYTALAIIFDKLAKNELSDDGLSEVTSALEESIQVIEKYSY